MQARSSTPRPTRDRRPTIEGLEGRALLAASPIGHVSGVVPPVGNLVGAPSFAGPATPSENLGPLKPDPGLVARVFAPVAYPATIPITNADGTMSNLPNPQPTQSELAREYFTAEFTGTYTVTPGHFAGDAATVKFVSRALRSNQFLRGKAQVTISTNADRTASFFGTAALFPQSVLYNGETAVLDLEGNPKGTPDPSTAPVYNAQGLPTHMVWQPDTASGTGYTGANGFNQGYGYMDAVYTPDRTPQKGTTASGKVTVLFQGLFNTAGILSYNDPATQ